MIKLKLVDNVRGGGFFPKYNFGLYAIASIRSKLSICLPFKEGSHVLVLLPL